MGYKKEKIGTHITHYTPKKKSVIRRFGKALKSSAKAAYEERKRRESPAYLKEELQRERLKAKIARVKQSRRQSYARSDQQFFGLYGYDSPKPAKRKSRKKKGKPKKRVEYFY